jgi:hypothetical protein
LLRQVCVALASASAWFGRLFEYPTRPVAFEYAIDAQYPGSDWSAA